MMAIRIAPAMARKHRLPVCVFGAMCGTGPEFADHDPEREPDVDDGDDPAPEDPAAYAALPVVVAFGVDPGAAEPHDEQNAQTEDRDVGGLVQPKVDKAGPPVRASQAEQLGGQPGGDGGNDSGQQDGEDVRQPGGCPLLSRPSRPPDGLGRRDDKRRPS